MRKLGVIMYLVVGMVFAQDSAFTLPDLFVTAKSETLMDNGYRVTQNLTPSWSMKWFLPEVSSNVREEDWLRKFSWQENTASPLYNEVDLAFGLPAYLKFNLYHGYQWEKKPYMLIVERTGAEVAYRGDSRETLYFLGTIALDDQTVLNLASREHNIGASRLSSLQLSLSGFWSLPFVYQGKMYSSNAYAGNVAGTWVQNSLELNVGKIELLEMVFPSRVKLDLISSKANAYTDIRVLSDKTYEFLNAKHEMQLGIGAWMNGNQGKLSLFCKDEFLSAVTQGIAVRWETKLMTVLPDLDSALKYDFSEWNDALLVPEERLSVGGYVTNLFGYNEESFVRLENDANRRVWDDVDGDGYYSQENIKNVFVVRGGVHWTAWHTALDRFLVRSEWAWYSNDIPNPEDHLLDLQYERNLWGGKLGINGFLVPREKTTSAGLYKGAYADVSVRFDQSISPDLFWGVQIIHLLSGGNERVAGHVMADPSLSFSLRMVY